MFDFQKFDVYQKAKILVVDAGKLRSEMHFDKTISDQLRRACTSILLNIAEGSSRFTNRDRKNFLVISRGSAFECVAILDLLLEEGQISMEVFGKFYTQLEEISKMLWGLIKKLDEKISAKE